MPKSKWLTQNMQYVKTQKKVLKTECL